MALTRRELIKAAAAAAGALVLPEAAFTRGEAAIPRRKLGKTGWMCSIYGVGTAEIPSTPETVKALNVLIDAGVNYIDTAPSYQGTRSESAIGEVLAKRRKDVFVATKTLARDADGAAAEVAQSMERLRTDRIDLLQIHAINTMSELDRVLSSGGAVKGLEKCKKEGKIRHIGITGHTRPEVILAAIEKYPFDTILVPLSPLDRHIGDFSAEVLPKARQLGIGVIAMKVVKGIERARGTKFEAEPFLRYAWSLPVPTAAIGLRRESEVAPNLAAARSFKPMSSEEMRALEASVKGDADDGALWWKRK